MLDFYTALTLCPSDIRKIGNLLTLHSVEPSPLQRVLFTPLFAPHDSLLLVRKLREANGTRVMFDSGGYYVQVGRLTYSELYYPLLQLYTKNSWADIYTLPDHVPTSQDSEETVWTKVRDTVLYGALFFQELPAYMQDKALGVVHGRTLEQVDYCVRVYLELGLKQMGFGSFGTIGKNSQVNVATSTAIDLARYVVDIARTNGVRVHLFGLGAPALVAMIYGVGAGSFDSSSWIKSAGYGQIFLPFTRAYNISHRNGRSRMQQGIEFGELERLKSLTQHDCPFCHSIESLQGRKLYRAVHNLLAVRQSVEMVNARCHSDIRRIYENGSPRYKQEYDKWLRES